MNFKKLLLSAALLGGAATSFAQNWSYVGTPYINQTVGFTTYLYFGDMEIAASGDILVGYWLYNGELNFAKYDGSTWAKLPSPGTFPVSDIDIEIHGSDYYMSYSGVRGANSYAFVRKYNGNSWDLQGDSVLLGNSGSGGFFDFLLDNAGVPTILGGVSAPLTDKQVMQLTGNTWSSVITIPNSAGTVFQENAGFFDAQNKLIFATQGFYMAGPVFFNVVSELDAGVRTTVGDTLFMQSANTKVQADAAGTPHVIFNTAITSKVMSYKLNGATWDFIADTTTTTGVMINADISGDGKTVFNTLQADVDRSMYLYDNAVVSNMDSVNVNGFSVASIQDVVVPAGSSEVYILAMEISSTGAQDYSVLKHTISGTSAVNGLPGTAEQVSIYPNPSNGMINIQLDGIKNAAAIQVYNLTGAVVYRGTVSGAKHQVDLRGQAPGTYLVHIHDGVTSRTEKVVIQ